MKLVYNDHGYNDDSYNDHGYNGNGYNEERKMDILVPNDFFSTQTTFKVITNQGKMSLTNNTDGFVIEFDSFRNFI